MNEVLRTCSLKAAFQSDQRFSGVRTLSTASALGAVSHCLLEEAARGKFDSHCGAGLDKEVARRWSQLVASEEQGLQERAQGPVPTHNRWPRYALTMATACRLTCRIARQRASRHPRPATVRKRSSSPNQVEVWYEGYGGKLVGRVDLVRRTRAGIELVDYKSGLVTEQEETRAKREGIRGAYKRQVLLYAGLVHENEGHWPIRATVESLIQGPHDVDVTPSRAKGAIDEALKLLDTYNCMATAGTVRGQPSDNTCRWCHFKAICPDYLEAAGESWEAPSATVMGRLRYVSDGPPTFIELDVTGGDLPKETVTVRAVPADISLALKGLEGASVSFGGLRRTFGSNDLLFDWASQGWKW